MARRRHRDLQPWLDYFRMLQRYERGGYLEVLPGRHEAYVTEAALLTLSPEAAGTAHLVRRLRAYAGWLARQGDGYLSHPFALHVVGDGGAHDLSCTVVVTRRRTWRRLWMTGDASETITYK